MRLVLATLCDAATVRDGVINILGGGITRMLRAQFPTTMDTDLALLFELEPAEVGVLHHIEVRVIKPSTGDIFARYRADWIYGADFSEEAAPGTKTSGPLALNLREVRLPSEGPYHIEVVNNDELFTTLSFGVAKVTNPEPIS